MANIECKYVMKKFESLDDITRTINNCFKTKIKPDNLQLIGQGAFGIVYGYKDKRGNKIAIKILDINDTDLEDMNKEINYSIMAGDADVGPKVYGAFYCKIGIPGNQESSSSGKKSNIFYGVIDENSSIKQFFIMDLYDTNLSNFLIGTRDTKLRENIASQCIGLIYKCIFDLGLICVDIKPSNFVYKIDTNEVRLIDYGYKFCTTEKDDDQEKEYIFVLLLIQLRYMLADTSVDSSFTNNSLYNNYISNEDNLKLLVKCINSPNNKVILQMYQHYGIISKDKMDIDTLKKLMNINTKKRVSRLVNLSDDSGNPKKAGSFKLEDIPLDSYKYLLPSLNDKELIEQISADLKSPNFFNSK